MTDKTPPEDDPGGWDRFERAVDVALHTPAKVIERVDQIIDPKDGVFVKLSGIEGELKHRPTHWQMVQMLTGLFAALTVIAMFIPTIQKAFGLSH